MSPLIKKQNKLLDICELVYRYRYAFALIVFALCVIFEISGSSIGLWSVYFPQTVDDGVLLGTSRAVRSDEWAVHTPMNFSQIFDGLNYFSETIRAEKTDAFLNCGLPVLSPLIVFRPFHIGYLFLGASRGLSFYWCGRNIALFMVCFELGMLISKRQKPISLAGALILTLSPMVQWWFSAGGVAELFIFGGAALLLLDLYTKSNVFWKRCLMLFGMVICAGGYILIMYPAWQIPMFYVFLALAVWVVVKNLKSCKIRYYDIISICTALVVFAASMGYVFITSLDTIKAITSTVYPGARMVTGGDFKTALTRYPINFFLPFKEKNLSTNLSEASTMLSLFPMDIILSVIALIKNKKKDICLILLLSVYVFFTAWCYIGFPKIIAKITFMYVSPATRAVIALGFTEILLIIRSLALLETALNRFTALAIAGISSFFVCFMCVKNDSAYFDDYRMVFLMLAALIAIFYLLLRYHAKYAKSALVILMAATMLVCGGTINPIRKGIDFLKENPLLQKIEEIAEADNGKWIVENAGFPIINYPLMAGAPTINSTNTYPIMERWEIIDEENKYSDIYNRYAHITVKYEKDNSYNGEQFILIQPDWFEVHLDLEEFKKLEVEYILTNQELPKESFKQLYDYSGYNIYQVVY